MIFFAFYFNRMDAWKEAMLATFRHSPERGTIPTSRDFKTGNPYAWGIGHQPVVEDPSSAELLTIAWEKCPGTHMFYADRALGQHYLSNNEHILQIQRIFGELLPMEHCYVNLTIVDEPKGKQKTGSRIPTNYSDLDAFSLGTIANGNYDNENIGGEKNGHTTWTDQDPRGNDNNEIDMGGKAGNDGNDTEAVHNGIDDNSDDEDNEDDKTVTLGGLFKPRQCGSVFRAPQRLLIRGSAGVGKTTLCKKIVYEMTRPQVSSEFAPWASLYDRVLWVPLRNLKLHKAGSNYQLRDLFQTEFFSMSTDCDTFAQALHNRRTTFPGRGHTLFLLDGVDEVSQQLDPEHELSKFLQSLLNQPNVIITSRPGSKLPVGLEPFDCELLSTGFEYEEVKDYICHSLIEDEKIEDILWFIHSHKILIDIIRIPVQLDALCYIWQVTRLSNDATGTPTIKYSTSTSIYQAIERKIWTKDIPRLKKCLPGRETTTENMARSLRSPRQIYSLVENDVAFVQLLAFSGILNDILYFEPHHCDSVHDHMDSPQLNGLLDHFLANFSLLRTMEPSSSFTQRAPALASRRTYHFIHLTYQEFFAAQYFVKQWTTGMKLCRLNLENGQVTFIDAHDIIRQHKYDVRYSVIWQFVSGLLEHRDGQSTPTTGASVAGLDDFIHALEQQPRDIVGTGHQKLIVRCLAEVQSAWEMATYGPVCKALQKWIVYELHR